jgi:hypothetical protein
MKSFQEIYDQILADMQAGRVNGATFHRSSASDQPPYIRKLKAKPFPEKKTPGTSPVFKKEKPHRTDQPRVLTESQKQALGCFQQYGELLDEFPGIADIKKSFRRLAKRLHPDKASHLSPEIQKMKALEFHRIHLAYRHLLEIHFNL